MSPVDIIDNTGEVIFTVPPLFDTNMLEILKRERGESLRDIYDNYTLHGNNIRSTAENYLNTALSSKLEKIKATTEPSESKTIAWSTIFDRYGVNTTNNSQDKDKDDDTQEDLDYT